MRTAKELTTTSVPKARADETAGLALERLRERKPEEASHLYLIDEASILTGQVPIERLIAAPPETLLGDLRGDPPIEVRPDDDAETVALLAVERHDADVAVADRFFARFGEGARLRSGDGRSGRRGLSAARD